ncbi:androgen-dependent TFPI-regulating protein isoform X2 [Phyllostomus discolor]|uniref:Androgen-dependent TFPI-regulating protein isoform X2 n=1 Tax=Phyllostomus discolor TaxID=89673 RepID=A0A7E6DTC0_9CHIR|nr:androgen-dependent TFPI-regulating protein isoform X2 [Phyllostomus discolor]
MTRTSTCIYHFLVLNWYVFLNYYISQQEKDKQKSKIFQNGGQWKYLTFLNLFLQAIFYGVACLEDTLKRMKGKKDIKFVTAFRDLLFTTLAFPVSTHTSIFPFSLVEIILRPHCYPMKKKGLTLLAAACLVYISRVLWIYLRTGTWVYPVFAKLSAVGLAVFFSLSYIFSASIYLLGEKLNHWKWGDLGQSRKKKK